MSIENTAHKSKMSGPSFARNMAWVPKLRTIDDVICYEYKFRGALCASLYNFKEPSSPKSWIHPNRGENDVK